MVRRRKRRRRRRAAVIKSNNPHLRGGEKQVSSILILKHSQLFGKYPNNLFVYVPLAGIPFPCARARQNQKKNSNLGTYVFGKTCKNTGGTVN